MLSLNDYPCSIFMSKICDYQYFYFVYHLIVLIVLIQCILLLMYGGTVKPIQNIFMSNCTSFIREDKTKKNVVFCNLCKRSDESRNISTTLF